MKATEALEMLTEGRFRFSQQSLALDSPDFGSRGILFHYSNLMYFVCHYILKCDQQPRNRTRDLEYPHLREEPH